MTEDEYIEQLDTLVKKMNDAKERLSRLLKRNEYAAAVTLRNHIEEDQKKFLLLLASKNKVIKDQEQF